ncbi:hypothetical protein [Sulfurimonas sp.]|uniref:hypothetical protein n=1 Tax=Sulfurimonas sp. TaxID=2022749 RepID=UPI0025DD75DF|nr:hypothetical protein [Sulfurimonas sp.]MBW6487536.1 hypothetical protein [Sulfurimonas sp.]
MKKVTLLLLAIGALFFSGCSVTNGVVDSVAYSYHSIKGIPFPKKTGKIYLESTTAKDTQNVTPLNSLLYGFDTEVAQNIMQCDSLPELTDVLTEHGWEITKNKEEADYHVYTSVLYCGYAEKWLKKSHRNIPLKDRVYYNAFIISNDKYELNITPEQIEKEDEESLKKLQKYYDAKNIKNYFNVFEQKYKYKYVPEHIKTLLTEENLVATDEEVVENNITKNERKTGNLSSHGIQTGATMSQTGNAKAGIALATVGVMIDVLSGSGSKKASELSGYKSEVKIYNPATKETKIEYISGITGVDSYYVYVGGVYKDYKYDADVMASGLFYK